MSNFFFQAEDGIRDGHVTGVRRVLFRSSPRLADLGPGGQDGRLLESDRSGGGLAGPRAVRGAGRLQVVRARPDRLLRRLRWGGERRRLVPADRKSTRLNSSHVAISYAVLCLKKQ